LKDANLTKVRCLKPKYYFENGKKQEVGICLNWTYIWARKVNTKKYCVVCSQEAYTELLCKNKSMYV